MDTHMADKTLAVIVVHLCAVWQATCSTNRDILHRQPSSSWNDF